MVQEMNILRCYSCHTFQVHIVKKANKWQCKICNEKQSIQHVYYQGTGQDCRLQVQHLNFMRHNKEQEALKELEKIEVAGEKNYPISVIEKPVTTGSKWDKYMIPRTGLHGDTSIRPSSYYEESTSNGTNAFHDNHYATNENFSGEKFMAEEFIDEEDNNPSSSSNYSNNPIEKKQNIVIIRKHVRRRPDSENEAPESQSDSLTFGVSSGTIFKRAKLVDETSFRKQNLCDLVELNRCNGAKSSAEAMKNSLNDTHDKLVLGQIENIMNVNDTEISKFHVKKKSIFETDCDDLDDILDF